MQITIKPADDELRLWGRRIAELGGQGTRAAIARAVNRSTTSAKGKVVKAVARSTSIPLQEVKASIFTVRAKAKGNGAIQGVILSRGAALPLKYFGAKQLATGTEATVYGDRKNFDHAFIWAGSRKSGLPVRDQHVFKRVGSGSFPIKMLFGPSVPQAAVEGDAAYEFVKTAQEMLPARITHELTRLLEGKK